MCAEHLKTGLEGERLAEQHLRRGGLKVLARRFGTPAGELDLVCAAGKTIVFVEVKTRSGAFAGAPHEAVTAEKQRKLGVAARWFLRRRGLEDRPCRFDVVSVILADGQAPRIQHFEDAFQP